MRNKVMKQIGFYLIGLFVYLLTACQAEEATLSSSEKMGYLRIELQHLTSTTNTKAVPENYDPKRFQVVIANDKGETVKTVSNISVTQTKKMEPIKLPVGSYTVTASSEGFDGQASGADIPYYVGSAKTTVANGISSEVALKCTLANVKVTVNFGEGMGKNFTSAEAVVKSGVTSIAPYTFTMNGASKPAYFPVGTLTLSLAVVDQKGTHHTKEYPIKPENREVEARDHFIVNFNTPDQGTMGNITITADDKTREYTFDFPVYRNPRTSLQVEAANAWSNFAYVKGKAASADGSSFDVTKMKFQYKAKSASAWSTVDATAAGSENGASLYKATLPSLSPATAYEYRLTYNDEEFTSEAISFITETQLKGGANFNWGFENWYKNGKHYYAASSAETRIWDSGNEGANTLKEINPTRPEESDVVKGKAARLGSATAAGQFAAASLFTGDFGSATLSPLGAKLSFGQKFNERPTQLTGYYKYNPGEITHTKLSSVEKGKRDTCAIYIALLDWTAPFAVNTGENEFFNPTTTPGVIAYGELPAEKCAPASMSSYEMFTIDLKYRDLTTKPTYILIVCSSSKYGDYFTGSKTSVLLLDEFDLIYGEPTVDTNYITSK